MLASGHQNKLSEQNALSFDVNSGPALECATTPASQMGCPVAAFVTVMIGGVTGVLTLFSVQGPHA
jgi:hypothetical protein